MAGRGGVACPGWGSGRDVSAPPHHVRPGRSLGGPAWAEIQEAGSVIRPGRERGANPAVRVWRDTVGIARGLGEQLGASPVALARLGLTHVRGLTLQQELQARKEQLEREQQDE
jgi:hypothetical protein